jgi:YfiH family protein
MMRGAAAEVSEQRVSGSGITRFELLEWRDEFGVVAGITGAAGDFDLGLWGTRQGATTMRNWKMFQDSFYPHFGQVVVGHQQHGTSVARWKGKQGGLVVLEGFDGHVTTERGVLLTVLVADCVPVYLFDPKSNAVALLHAGWRGIASGILEAGVEQLRAVGGPQSGKLVMHCGVAICGRCYEVGPEVATQVLGSVVNETKTLDLRAALADRAARLGIGRVTLSPFCTAHHLGEFHSFRARGEAAGRMAAYLGLPLS